MADLVLARQLDAMAFVLVGLGLVGLALYLRLRVFIGTRPGGVDTWYYLASAEAIRRQNRLPISLPQYLLHDRTESYPPIFPLFLAALPQRWLRRYFWLVSPLIDTAHLLLLYVLSYRLTDSVLAAGVAGLIYAVTPQLISETRNLNGRAFASLLQTVAMLVLLRSLLPEPGITARLFGPSETGLWFVAVVLIALLYNTHTSTTIAFLVSTLALTVVYSEPRFVLAGILGLPAAIVLSGGYYLRVIMNHVHAARFWARNVHLTRAHQVADSPVLSSTNGAVPARARGLYRADLRSVAWLAIRLVGENPFILAMLILQPPHEEWGGHMYWWAAAILGWAVATTFVPPLRILGPGLHYMKASVFPSAYALAVTVNIQEGLSLGRAVVLVCLVASFGALAYFYRVMAQRETEHTAQTPPDLADAATYLDTLPGKAVLVLPTMYADFVAFAAQKAVVWGGHSGDLRKLEEFFPVIRRPLEYFFQRYQVDYVLLDLAYTTPRALRLEDRIEQLAAFGPITVYAVLSTASAPTLSASGSAPVSMR
jgi:hypothetical protein